MSATKRSGPFSGPLSAVVSFVAAALAVTAFAATAFTVTVPAMPAFAAAPSSTAQPPNPSKTQYVEGEVLVLLKNNTLEKKLTARSVESGGGKIYASGVAAKAGAKLEATYGALSAQSGKIFAMMKSDVKTTEELIAELEKDPNVLSAAPNYIVYAMDTEPNDPSYSALWGMPKINAPAAWDKTTGNHDIYVGVLDTGVDYNHPDLGDNMAANWGWNFTGVDSADFMDRAGHGTHVAGTIGAVGDNGKGVAGVNWTTSVIPIKVLGDGGSGTSGMIINGINKITQYLTENPTMHIAAINLSLGGWGSATPQQMKSSSYWEAFKTLSDTNRTVIAVAAGNDHREVGKPNPNQENDDDIPVGLYVYPASFIDIDNMIVVGAIDNNNNAAAFTNWSETFVGLVAPGVGIRSTIPNQNYSNYNGTSMATPHVAGAVALLASYRPDLTASELKELLLTTANPAINPVLNNSYNTENQKVSRYGLLDIGAAIEAATIASPILVTSISIDPATPGPLYTNDESQKTVALTATILPEDASIKTVNWTTDDPSVATVGLYT
ncbi:MAG: S8 family serine peptidase, partial [Synergistaceae bacterium]|nr:S8 family serine peptidase [Synergistaceae bacterium]